MSAPPASIPEHWMMCKTGRQFRAAVAGEWRQTEAGAGIVVAEERPEENLPIKRVVERADGTNAEGEWLVLSTILAYV